MILNWRAIRPLNGSRARGFEELCAQLARAESPAGLRFERKGTPDAGVECYTVLNDDTEWGWQAKHFDTLGDSQWKQLDDSVETALKKHPRLVQYFVCVPLDLSDARIPRKMSARQRWDKHVQTWTRWASDRGMNVKFVYWGSSKLLELLAQSQHVGLVKFWFDVQGFDKVWFTARLDDALKTAGPRYTPEINVALPIISKFDAFGRTEEFFEQIKACALEIRKKLQAFEYSEPEFSDPTLDAFVSELSSKVKAILTELSAVTVQPIGDLPFQQIADQMATTEATTEKLERLLLEREQEQEATSQTGADALTSPYRRNPFRERHYRLIGLSSELAKTREILKHAEEVAGHSLMILNGDAGTGKTHLLCDVAKQRVAAGRPTILLMGQRFVSKDAPWVQIFQQLDLHDISAEEFVGALEAAAQAACCRTLVMIDAINEGSGRLIWPTHLAAFLASLERSPWIGIVLSIRSSYEKIIIPEEIRDRAVGVTHQGFVDHEYDATRTFFKHYELELPSTPLLTPEFRNPLFLKTLCQGLHARGEHRLPRGFHGITAVFDLYLSAINDRLAGLLDFDPKDALVRRTLESFANALVASEERWLTRTKAKEIVNALLPGRDFERSLYRGLVSEGVLIEEGWWREGAADEEVVFVAYERFADHLVAKALLDEHLDTSAPAVAFSPGAPLAFICDKSAYVAPGLLEAMCIQIPECTGQELTSLAPKSVDRRNMRYAFRQSLVWRAPTAFSQDTVKALNDSIRTQYDWDDSLDVLLTVAMLPDHPFNAHFLDQRLRRDTMPERDAWWSIYLHHAWGNRGAVDRLVDWASSLTQSTVLDDETVDLSATTLAWMLTTSNRFLRDRATKALVNLLTGRLDAVARLVQQFDDVDDLYVKERVYAVAYGTAMRSHDPREIGRLAKCVYDHVFASGSPPAHILLRDYARGVVERAIYVGADIQVDERLIRPPYKSVWPIIPTEDDIKPLLPNWSRGSHDNGDLEWARNRIGSSVMDDDFAYYVIGTNLPSSNWLSLRLDEPIWQSPEDHLAMILDDFSEEETAAWEAYDLSRRLYRPKLIDAIRSVSLAEDVADDPSHKTISTEDPDSGLESAEEERGAAKAKLVSVLTKEHVDALEPVLTVMKNNRGRHPPYFDLRQIQRYVLWRVFNLGWTADHFGHFDRFSIGYHGRGASKAERIGKKYQWIAYHEIMALVADNFQYREQFRESDGDRAYEGPWQEHLRDIDPSCTLRAIPGGTSWDAHSLAWWGSIQYENWGAPHQPNEWIVCRDDLPKVEELLSVTNPQDGTRWLNVNGYFSWRQRIPIDQEITDVERREFWYICTGYLIRAEDAEAFLKWSEGVDFWGCWMPEPPVVYRMFLGEHVWSSASRYFQKPYFGDDGWAQPDRNCCPLKLQMVAFEYLKEASGFDCSVDESYTLRLPASYLVNGLGLQWSGAGADYLDAEGQLAAFDPTAHDNGPTALLLREDLLKEFLTREGLMLCWTVLGEKRVIGAGHTPGYNFSLRITRAFVLSDNGPVGFLSDKVYNYRTGAGTKEDVP